MCFSRTAASDLRFEMQFQRRCRLQTLDGLRIFFVMRCIRIFPSVLKIF